MTMFRPFRPTDKESVSDPEILAILNKIHEAEAPDMDAVTSLVTNYSPEEMAGLEKITTYIQRLQIINVPTAKLTDEGVTEALVSIMMMVGYEGQIVSVGFHVAMLHDIRDMIDMMILDAEGVDGIDRKEG